MPYLMNRPLKANRLLAFPFAAVVLSGCMSFRDSVESELSSESPPILASQGIIPAGANAEPPAAIRYGRYTLANTSPRFEQVDLQSQIVDIQIPEGLAPNVGDALSYVLRYSGYQLCQADSNIQLLYSHPLPGSHYHLGPITLRNALVTLAGVAWQTIIDEKARSVCFEARDSSVSVWASETLSTPPIDRNPHMGGER